MTTTTRLAEQIEQRRLADEALDTIIAAIAMLNGDVVTPAVLGRRDVVRDLRSSLLTLHVALGAPNAWDALRNVPSLRASLERCKLLGKPLDVEDRMAADYSGIEAPELPGLDKSIATVRELIADKDRRIVEIKGEIDALDESPDNPGFSQAIVDADFDDMEKRIAARGSGIFTAGVILALVYVLVGLFAGYAIGVWQ